MTRENVMNARLVIGFGDRKFSIFADEITTFLSECEEMGLPKVHDVSNLLDELAASITTAEATDEAKKDQLVKLITELSLLLQGMIYEGV